MNERAVFLQHRLGDDLERGILPIDINRLGEHAPQPVGAFEQTAWALEAAPGQRGSVDSAHPRHPGRESLPLRHRFGMDTGERDVVNRRDRNRIRDFDGGESEKSPRARGGGDRELRGVVEALRHHRDCG